jgi:hypothetical protein
MQSGALMNSAKRRARRLRIFNSIYHNRPRTHRRCRTSRSDLGLRWPARLVATTAEDRLSFRRNPHTSFAAASDCRAIEICEYTP